MTLLGPKDRLDYNVQAVLRGDLKPDMLAWFVSRGQEHLGLPVNGRAAGETLVALWEIIHKAPSTQTIGARLLGCAVSDIGKGEEGENNTGPYVSRLRHEAGLEWSKGPWCAVAVSAWLVRTEGSKLTFHVSASARTLFDNAVASPTSRLLLEDPEPGAIICWVRRNRLGIKVGHHIAVIEKFEKQRDWLQTVDGNHNRPGQRFAQVDRFTHPQGSWRKDLVGVVALS